MLSAREIALKILYEVEENGGYLNIVFKNSLDKSSLSKEDSALVKELVFGVMKYKITLDYIISSFSKIKLKKISPYILNILRLGAYQLKFMDKIPESAAVNESVKLAKKYGHKAAFGFVNGVLRSIARQEGIVYPDKNKDLVGYLSVKYAHPKELTQYFLDLYGSSFAEELLKANNETPPIYGRVNTLKTSRDELIKYLDKENVNAKTASLTECGVVLSGLGNVDNSKAYQEGLFTIQDQSSQLAALALSPKKGEFVLDMCAAPGGKATHMAELMENSGTMIACDIYEKRLQMISDSANRLGISMIETKCLDATKFNAEWENKADKVLLDVPCSGLGIIRRKPDIKYKENITNFEDLVTIQKNILNICSKYLKIKGELVYSTCTMNPKEDLEVVEDFLNANPSFELMPIEHELIGQSIKEELTKGYLYIYPNVHGSDGFFICKLKRRA